MNSAQRRRRDQIEELVRIAQSAGLGSRELVDAVSGVLNFGQRDLNLTTSISRAARVNNAGLMAQLYVLQEAWGTKRVATWLQKTGGVLDAIVKATSTTPEEREADVGRHNINDDGCVVSS